MKSAIRIAEIRILGTILALLSSCGARAESSNDTTNDTSSATRTPPPERAESAPAKLDESAFRMVSERNIFNANRIGSTVRSSSTRRPTRVETFALVGTMAYEKGVFAFFEGSSSEFTKALKPDGLIAGHKVVDILANGVKLEMDGQVMELAIGSGMRREDQGAWKISEVTVSENNAVSPSDGGSRNSRNGRSRRGNDSSSDRSTVAGSSSPDTGSSAPNADQSEILKRLMERREKENK